MAERSSQNHKRSFSFRIIIPVILTIAAFIISMYVIFIPSLENNLIKQKKQMIRELTQSAWSILQKFHNEELSGQLTTEEAQNKALDIFQTLRYGEDSKDYFWITDMTPVMIIHPYRPDLNGTNLENLLDPNGKKLFVESIVLVRSESEGFIDYFWQWKDDSTRIVPKLSFVKGFEPWGWVVGTGIYLDDVHNEISQLKKRLVLVSLFIILFVSGVLIYILRTSLLVENKRRRAEADLKESRERYRSLVEASKEGTLMSLDGKISYANPYFLDLFTYQPADLIGRSPEELFDPDTSEILEAYRDFISQDVGFTQLEAKWIGKNGFKHPVLLAISRISIADKKGCIFIARELSAQQKMARQIDDLGEELQTSLLFMNQPVRFVARSPLACSMNATIRTCAEEMSRKNQNGILVRGSKGEYLGIVTDHDLRQRVLARGKDYNDPVYSIMSSPVVTIADNALLFEALLSLQHNDVTHIAITDPSGKLTGLISYEELLEMQQNTTAFLMKQIQQAEHSDDLIQYSRKTTGIVKVLEQSGAKTRNITRIITAVTDALTQRFVELAINEAGTPPAPYAFISLGSEGRGEQTLATDQDNAIIYKNNLPDKENQVKDYFQALGQKVNDCLNMSGYHYCKGKIMAGNPRWCQPLSKWKQDFKDWINNAEPEAVMDASIFFDFRIVCGDSTITNELQQFVDKTVQHQQPFFYQMADQTLKFKIGSDLSTLLKVDQLSEQKVFDSKRIIFPVTAFARLYALQNQIKIRNTFGRLLQLKQSGILSDELFTRLSDGYDFLMMLRFKSQLQAIDRNQDITNHVPMGLLSDMDIIHLKKILGTVSEIQSKIRLDFNIGK